MAIPINPQIEPLPESKKTDYWNKQFDTNREHWNYPNGTTREQIANDIARAKKAQEMAKHDPGIVQEFNNTVSNAISAKDSWPSNWKEAIDTAIDKVITKNPQSFDPAASAFYTAPRTLDCKSVRTAAEKYYTDVNGSPRLKAYDVPSGQLPGEVAAGIPKLGDIAVCRNSWRRD